MKPLRTQQGAIAPVWLYMAGAIAVMLALAGLVKVWSNYTTSLDKRGYDRGTLEATARYQARDNAQLQAVVVAQRAAEIRAAKAEADAAKAQSVASSNYAKGVQDGKNRLAAFIADSRSGAIKLRDPGQNGTGPACGNQTGKAETAGSAPGSNGDTQGRLSGQASEFLFSLANEADEIVRQLIAAQAVIVSDRVLCNAQ
ncbi:MAG: lysis protein [Gallionella sp.]|nr:lysis protein [Gallionella sp.]